MSRRSFVQMNFKSKLKQLSTQQRLMMLLVFFVLVFCGFTAWREWKAAPVRQHIEAGMNFVQNGQGAAAESQWLQAVRLDPNNQQAWELLGDFYKAAKLWPQAIEAYRHALKLNPTVADLNARLAQCAAEMQDFKGAQTYAEAELRQHPNNIASLKILADIAKKYNRSEEQLKRLQRLADLQPKDAESLGALAQELTVRYEYDKARPLIERILQIDPNFDLAYILRGLIYFNADPTPQNLVKAEADFKKVLRLNPQSFDAHRYLGRVYMRMNKPQQAVEQFEAVGQGRPYASAHFLELANAYSKTGNVSKANELRRRFTALKQLNYQVMDLKERLDREPDDFNDNLKLGLLTMRCLNSDADSYHLQHFRYVQQQLQAPVYYLAKALAARPGDANVLAAMRQLESVYRPYLEAGLKALNKGDWKTAQWNLAHVLLLSPDDPRTQNAMKQVAIKRMPLGPNGFLSIVPSGAVGDNNLLN